MVVVDRIRPDMAAQAPSHHDVVRLSRSAARLSMMIRRVQFSRKLSWQQRLATAEELERQLHAVGARLARWLIRLLLVSAELPQPPTDEPRPVMTSEPMSGSISTLAPPTRPATGTRLEDVAA